MDNSAVGVLIMAAGKGTRMKSDLPKVLHRVLDKPMLGYLLNTVDNCAFAGTAVLVGYQGEEVRDYLRDYPEVDVVWQREQLGTGHAVQTARDWWQKFDQLVVLNGDLPLLTGETLKRAVAEHIDSGAACSLLSFLTDAPDGYGRIVRSATGGVAVVEHKDATEEQRQIREVNGGCYVFDVKKLLTVIAHIRNDNAQHEYYLPDVLSLMGEGGMKVSATVVPESEMLGVNTQRELAAVSRVMRYAIIDRWMAAGVQVLDPSAVWVGSDVTLESGVILMPGVQIWGNSFIGAGSFVGPFCVLHNAVLGRDTHLTANVVVEDSRLGDGAKAGPFCYIREHSELKENAFAGKFVELKKTTVGRGSKVPHLSYMGDATLGESVNIGAGCVTCNYDGINKHPTKIGDRCFVGSDTMLVAPVNMADDSMTAAGSTITSDIPEGALGVGRAHQRNIEGWVKKQRQHG